MSKQLEIIEELQSESINTNRYSSEIEASIHNDSNDFKP